MKLFIDGTYKCLPVYLCLQSLFMSGKHKSLRIGLVNDQPLWLILVKTNLLAQHPIFIRVEHSLASYGSISGQFEINIWLKYTQHYFPKKNVCLTASEQPGIIVLRRKVVDEPFLSI